MNMRKGTFLSVLVPLALLLACEKQPGTVPVTGITISPDSVEITDGESVTLTATITPSDATDQKVLWSSSSPNITVSNGTVKASFKPGSPTTTVNGKLVLGHGTITAKTEDGGKTAKCKVTVLAKTVAVTGVSLTETSLQLKKGDTHTLKANVQPSDATDKTVKWTSSDTAVATVDQDGTVTAVGGGNAKITASAGGVSATCSVSVTVPVTGIHLNMILLTLEKGAFALLEATVSPDDAMDKTVQWSSDNPSVVSVDQNGKVTALEEGKAKITASAGGFTASCTVICVSIPVTAVTLDKTSLSLAKGSSETLTATVSPRNATDKTVTWTSSNPAVATVDQNGLVTAVNSGNATITASAGDFSATCEVSVVIPVTSISLSSKNLTLKVGETAMLDATILPEDATDKNVIWHSSHPDVASVEGGLVTAIGFGYAEITAQVDGLADFCTVTVLADSPESVIADYLGGNVTFGDGSMLTGGYLDFRITNMSTETVHVKTVQLIDGESGAASDLLSIDGDLEAGQSLDKRINVPASGIYSPTAVFTYTYRGEEYTCSAKYFEDIIKLRRRP